jgi:hypothetical protein
VAFVVFKNRCQIQEIRCLGSETAEGHEGLEARMLGDERLWVKPVGV